MVKKTLNIDPKLLKEAREAVRAATDTETIQLGLKALIRHAAYQRMLTFIGSEPGAKDVPRRREKPRSKRRAA
jgi:hypothetical protein